MSYLSDLQWKANNLNAQKSGVENELRKLRSRASEVEKLANNLANVGDNYFYDINKYANRIAENISSAMQGAHGTENVIECVNTGMENSAAYDGKLASGLYELRRELARVNSKIIELESQLASIKSNIWSVNESIRGEQRRIVEEEAQKRWDAIFGE